MTISNYYSFNPYEHYELSFKLREAVSEYKDTTLRGLNAFCEDAKAERIAEFKAAHKPVDGTPEEMRAFYEKLAHFKASLERIADRQRPESLLNFGNAADEDCDHTPQFIKMYQKMIMHESSL